VVVAILILVVLVVPIVVFEVLAIVLDVGFVMVAVVARVKVRLTTAFSCVMLMASVGLC